MGVYVITEVWNYPGDSGSEVLVFADKDKAQEAFKKIKAGILDEIVEKFPGEYNVESYSDYYAAWCINSFTSAHHKVNLKFKDVK